MDKKWHKNSCELLLFAPFFQVFFSSCKQLGKLSVPGSLYQRADVLAKKQIRRMLFQILCFKGKGMKGRLRHRLVPPRWCPRGLHNRSHSSQRSTVALGAPTAPAVGRCQRAGAAEAPGRASHSTELILRAQQPWDEGRPPVGGD